jgi:hypothetical protein
MGRMAPNPPIAARRVAPLSRHEQAAIQDLIYRLSRQFPEMDRAEIDRAVRGEYAGYEHSKVRDFVPVLVERSVRSELKHAGPRPRA